MTRVLTAEEVSREGGPGRQEGGGIKAREGKQVGVGTVPGG